MIIQLVCAFLAGTCIVISRSINAYLSVHIGAYQGSFFNYFTGLIGSIVLWLLLSFPTLHTLSLFQTIPHYAMFIGGVIGVVNIVILNFIVTKISPLQLTLIVFIAQLVTGMVIDYFFYDLFSIKKVIGGMIVLLGLCHYQYVQRKEKGM